MSRVCTYHFVYVNMTRGIRLLPLAFRVRGHLLQWLKRWKSLGRVQRIEAQIGLSVEVTAFALPRPNASAKLAAEAVGEKHCKGQLSTWHPAPLECKALLEAPVHGPEAVLLRYMFQHTCNTCP